MEWCLNKLWILWSFMEIMVPCYLNKLSLVWSLDLIFKKNMRNQNPSLHLITELSVSLVGSLFYFFFSFKQLDCYKQWEITFRNIWKTLNKFSQPSFLLIGHLVSKTAEKYQCQDYSLSGCTFLMIKNYSTPHKHIKK